MKAKKQKPIQQYLTALWQKYRQNGIIPGVVLTVATIVIALVSLLIVELLKVGATSLSYLTMILMYGSSSAMILIGLLEIVAAILLSFGLAILVYYLNVSLQYQMQATLIQSDKKISLRSIWQEFRQLNKNQQLRLYLYANLFILLWQLPILVINYFFGSHQIVADILLVVAAVILIWKQLEYSQAAFLYRERQPKFLGQSQRLALTASRRFLEGSRQKLLKVVILLAIPVIIWSGIWGVTWYYGFYFWEPIMIYGAPIIEVLGICFYLPIVMLVLADFYERHRTPETVAAAFHALFKPVAKLTGVDHPVRSAK
ncbi:hypothetical protein [Liquorilactobacillus sicerae]|uniref:hypothetical protein n=1 Tax=Liquorilactobacillus sicerae TaxID=1416943 RepID=UPI0024801F0C|nr:hypothetical protein [Liquorilactobacillus sicerae]